MDVLKIDLTQGTATARPVVNIERWAKPPQDDEDTHYIEQPGGVPIGATWNEKSGDLAPPADEPGPTAEKVALAFLQDTDARMPRSVEDMLDALDPDTFAQVAQETRDLLAARKAARDKLPL